MGVSDISRRFDAILGARRGLGLDERTDPLSFVFNVESVSALLDRFHDEGLVMRPGRYLPVKVFYEPGSFPESWQLRRVSSDFADYEEAVIKAAWLRWEPSSPSLPSRHVVVIVGTSVSSERTIYAEDSSSVVFATGTGAPILTPASR